MATITVNGLDIPHATSSLEGFREWVATLGEDAPRVHFSKGWVYIEMPQSHRSHGPLVTRINHTLLALCQELDLGRYCEPPSWITDVATGLSTEPDGYLVIWESFEAGKVRINPQRESEMLGRPDMALEVVSRSSERKELEELVADYAAAGVFEYWIADGRTSPARLDILVLADGKYLAQPADPESWIASPLWRRAFRLRAFVDRAGLPDFVLESRPLDA